MNLSKYIKISFIFFILLCSSVSADDLNLYTYQTITDNIVKIPAADIMVPKGFKAQITSQWDRLDGNFPGHEVIGIENTDNTVGIYIFTNESYYQFQNRNNFGISMPQQQGPDYERRITIMNYMDSSSVLEVFLNNLGFNNRKQIKSLPVDENKLQTLKTNLLKTAQIEVQKIHQMNVMARTDMRTTLNDVRVDMAKKQYSVGYGKIEASTCVGAITTTIANNMIANVTTSWEISYFILFRANSSELFDKYYSTYQTVISNARIRPEFYYLNMKLKQMNEERVAKIGAVRAKVSLEAQREQIMGTYSSSTNGEAVSTSEKVMNMWDDVIKEVDEYTTLDGRKLKTSMYNETVAQDGDTFYIGKKTGVPNGFKELSKSY
ncbi:MAG: hypothetical protein II961_05545 [Candidatus Riflebacteria bacterium]|nr:hypothetical protein [Candidatus Riflebacteria bacterium]